LRYVEIPNALERHDDALERHDGLDALDALERHDALE
jgi:hypothetical protein